MFKTILLYNQNIKELEIYSSDKNKLITKKFGDLSLNVKKHEHFIENINEKYKEAKNHIEKHKEIKKHDYNYDIFKEKQKVKIKEDEKHYLKTKKI